MAKRAWIMALLLAVCVAGTALADPLGRSVQTILKNIDTATEKYIKKLGDKDFQTGYDKAAMKANADKLKEQKFLQGIVHPMENVYYVLKTADGMWVGLDLAGLHGNYNTGNVKEYLQSQADGKQKLYTLDGETMKPYTAESTEVFTPYTGK